MVRGGPGSYRLRMNESEIEAEIHTLRDGGLLMQACTNFLFIVFMILTSQMILLLLIIYYLFVLAFLINMSTFHLSKLLHITLLTVRWKQSHYIRRGRSSWNSPSY